MTTAKLHQDADSALQFGNVTEAIRCLEQITIAEPNDFEAWIKLAALRRASEQPAKALDAVNSALAVRPNEFLAMLLKGGLHEQLGEIGRAAEVYRAVLHLANDQTNLHPSIVAQLEKTRTFLGQLRSRLLSVIPDCDQLDQIHLDRMNRFVENVHDRRPIFHQAPTHYRYPNLPDVEFFDHAYPDLLARLRQVWPEILAEYRNLAERHADRKLPYVDFAPGQPMGQWKDLNKSDAWNVFHLIRYGEHDPINAALCPKTIEVFSGPDQVDVPGITPNLVFSLLAPKTKIPPHHGVANFRTLVHLPLIVPEGCGFRVGSETRQWQAGEPWIFDDSIEHEAWNDSDELRVILIADLWRPELDGQDRKIIRNFVQAQAATSEIAGL